MMPRRGGFTLIEIIIVLVLVSILATIGLNRFWAAKDRSLISSMQSDIRNMAAEQEHYYDRYLVYAAAPADLVDFRSTPGITLTVTYAQNDGWAGNAVHVSLLGRQCGYYSGNAPAASGAPATANGVIGCN